MKIAIGADHRGFGLKRVISEQLKKKGHSVLDFGTFSKESCDYPVYSLKVGEAVAKRKAAFGVFICKTGIGSAVALNKVKGVRAALVHNLKGAKFSRLHNNANVLVLGSDFVKADQAKKIVAAWLNTEFEAGRHSRRVEQITKIEEGHGL
jgi:ribose 5-phosphate isomerase B